jgi:hypothetical protein
MKKYSLKEVYGMGGEVIKFKTSQGSEYVYYVGEEMSERSKQSGGSQQGEKFGKMNCIFLDLEGYPKVIDPFLNKIYIGIIDDDKFIKIKNIKGVEGEIVLLQISKKSGEQSFVGSGRIKREPVIGCRPYEWLYVGDMCHRHIGNEIVEIMR